MSYFYGLKKSKMKISKKLFEMFFRHCLMKVRDEARAA